MPRYLIERTFPNGLDVPASDAGASLRRAVTDTVFGVTWIHPARRRMASASTAFTTLPRRMRSAARGMRAALGDTRG